MINKTKKFRTIRAIGRIDRQGRIVPKEVSLKKNAGRDVHVFLYTKELLASEKKETIRGIKIGALEAVLLVLAMVGMAIGAWYGIHIGVGK